MNMPKWFFVITVLIYASFYPITFAQLASAEIESMSRQADIIILGKVATQKSSWNEDKSRIYTTATIQVEESLKGSNQNLIEIRYLGGEVGDIGELYSHTPKFENSEEILVFLKKEKTGTSYKVFNGEDGKLTVITDAKTGEKFTSQNVKLNTLTTQIKNYVNE